MKHLRNIGLVAHVDAGKTTTTEHMLFESGRIRSLGRVDSGTTQTDWLDIERERGISVRAATTAFDWNGCMINLIDTPGHVDFSSEVERSLRVLDGAVLIVSAAEGVQAHTETLWRSLQALSIPTLVFVNKMDRIGADSRRVLAQLRKELSPDMVPMQQPIGAAETFTGLINFWAAALPNPAFRETLTELVAEHDERVLEAYLAGDHLPERELRERLVELVRQCRAYPVLYGAASRGVGIRELMNAIVELLPSPVGDSAGPPSGIVFKLERDKTMGKIAYVRLYEGALRNRDSVRNHTQDIEEKITQIRKVHVRHHEDVGLLEAGDIAAVCGLGRVRIGDVLGHPGAIPPEHRLAVPLLTVQAHPAADADYAKLVQALQELSEEDPLLDLQWLPDDRELHIKVMGPIQLEVLSHLLKSRFSLEVRFDEPSVLYKETPRRAGCGFVAYTMPKPCWAILKFDIEPLPAGSGLHYGASVRAEKLLPAYQHEVERRVPEALRQGLFGWEVTDLKVTLIEGEHHVWHTHPLDFVVATPMGIMNGLEQTGTVLLEPYLRFRIAVPEEAGGRIIGDLVAMRAEFESPVIAGGRFTVEGAVPVATSLSYPMQLGSLTGGRGTFAARFDGYRPCPPEVNVVRRRNGIDPRDTAKYILSVRNALGRG